MYEKRIECVIPPPPTVNVNKMLLSDERSIWLTESYSTRERILHLHYSDRIKGLFSSSVNIGSKIVLSSICMYALDHCCAGSSQS